VRALARDGELTAQLVRRQRADRPESAGRADRAGQAPAREAAAHPRLDDRVLETETLAQAHTSTVPAGPARAPCGTSRSGQAQPRTRRAIRTRCPSASTSRTSR